VAWIESHQELGRHPKTKKFARLLGISLPAAVGHLHYFWWWAMDYAQDGDLSRYEITDIAEACEWEGEPEKLWEALIQVGFVDEEIRIHDWCDYAGRLLEKREQNKERKRKSRAKSKEVTETTEGCHADVLHPSHAESKEVTETTEGCHVDVTHPSRTRHVPVTGLPNLTEPNLTIPNHKKEEEEDARVKQACQFYQANFGMISPYYAEKITDWIATMSLDAVMLAMQQALNHNAKKWTYVHKILHDWHRQGARTKEQCEALVTDFEARKDRANENLNKTKSGRASPTNRENQSIAKSRFAHLAKPGRAKLPLPEVQR